MTVISIFSGIGRCLSGFIADRIGVTNALFLVALISGLIQLLVWNFVHTYPGIVSCPRPHVCFVPDHPGTDGVICIVRLFRFDILVAGDPRRFVSFDLNLYDLLNDESEAAWFYGTDNLASLSGLLFLCAAPGKYTPHHNGLRKTNLTGFSAR